MLFAKRVKAEEAKPLPTAAEAESPLVAELVSRGLHRDSARKLVAEREAGVIAERIEAFDWLMGTKDKPEKPSGYLFTSIEKEFPLPDGFLATKRAKAISERKRMAAIEEAKKRSDEAEQKKAEQRMADERRQRVNGFLASLPQQQREEFEAAAFADGPADLVSNYRKSLDGGLRVFAETFRYQLLDLAVSQRTSAMSASA